MAEITKIVVSLHCHTCSVFSKLSTYCSKAPAVTNVKIIVQKAGKDPEENFLRCFTEIKIDSGALHCFRTRNTASIMTHAA